MYEVTARALQLLEAGCRARGLTPEQLVQGTGVAASVLRTGDGRVDWDDFARVCDRAGDLLGGAGELHEVGAVAIQSPGARALRVIAELFPSALPIYRLGTTWYAPMLIYNLQFEFDELPTDQARVTIAIPQPHAPCAAFLHMVHGALRAMPRFIGLPEAEIRAIIEPRRGEYLITPPRRQSLMQRARRAARVLLAANAAIDELAAQQRSLRESALARERLVHDFRRVIDGIPDAVLVHSNGVIRYANPAFLHVVGLGPGTDLAGRHVREFLHPDDPAYGAEPFLGAGPHGRGGDLRLRGPGDSVVVLEALASQPVEFNGPALLLSARDVTMRKQAELQVALADRMVAVGTLAAGVAHEINNPLSYVLANLRQMRRTISRVADRIPPDVLTDLHAMMDDAGEGAERVSNIVGDLGTFSRADDELVGPVDVRTIMDRALKMAGNEIRHRARLVRDYHETPPARANEVRLAQVFLNLLVNAAQAIPVGRADEHEIRVTIRSDGDMVLVEVRDTGVGVPAEIKARVFDPFFTTKPVGSGTGLGLSICHGIITGLGGTITLADAPGGGTVATVRLPQAERAARAPVAAVSGGGHPLRSARVLIVDDEPRVAAALGRALEGHTVTALRDGRAALDLLTHEREFDVVFCDLMMPELSGMEFYARVAALRPGLEQRIVFMTGGAFTPAAREFLRRVDNACLEKPFRVEQVLELIEKVQGGQAEAP